MMSAWASVQAYLGLREDDVIGLALSPVLQLRAVQPADGAGRRRNRGAGTFGGISGEGGRDAGARAGHASFPACRRCSRRCWDCSDLARFDLGAVRMLTNAAAALPDNHVQRLRAAFPQAQLFSMYGLTECMRVTYLPPEELDVDPAASAAACRTRSTG